MDPAPNYRFFEPHLTVFYCERCCDPASLDTTGGSNRAHLFPSCAGDVSGQRIGQAFADGADGVLILSCVGRGWITPREMSRVPALITAYRRRLAAMGARRELRSTGLASGPTNEPAVQYGSAGTSARG
jgi:hypothetical protein